MSFYKHKKKYLFALVVIILGVFLAQGFWFQRDLSESLLFNQSASNFYSPVIRDHQRLNRSVAVRILESRVSYYLPKGIQDYLKLQHPFNNQNCVSFSKRVTKSCRERAPHYIQGYPTKFCYELGEDVRIYYAADLMPTGRWIQEVQFFNAIDDKGVIQETFPNSKHRLKRQKCASFYGKGCQFQKSLTISSTKLGVGEYYAQLKDDQGNLSQRIHFNVCHALRQNPDRSKIVVMFPDFTWQAYNYEGGGNFYGMFDKEGWNGKLPKNLLFSVSLNRPLSSGLAFFHTPDYTLTLLNIFKKEGILYHTTSNSDLHHNPHVLKNAKILIIAGHDEYWTQEIRDAIDQFIKKGGHVANFSGNVAWWKVNASKNTLFVNKSNVNIKNKKEFNETGEFEYKFHQCTSKILGVSFKYAGYPVQLTNSNLPGWDTIKNLKDIKDILIIKPKHPIFFGVPFEKDNRWEGAQYDLVYEEIDGAPLTKEDQLNTNVLKLPNGSTLTVLGTTYGRYVDIKKVGIITEFVPFQKGGTVISIGTIGCCNALKKGDPVARKVLINTIRYLQSKEKNSDQS